jgi:hypothetical protein
LLHWQNNEYHILRGCLALGIQHAMRMRHIAICDLSGSTRFFHSIWLTARYWRKQVMKHETYVLIFSTTFVLDVSYSEKNRARYDQNCAAVFILSTCYSCQILMNLEFSWQIFEKYSNVNFHENPISGSRVVPSGLADRQTDRHNEASSRFSQFCERA